MTDLQPISKFLQKIGSPSRDVLGRKDISCAELYRIWMSLFQMSSGKKKAAGCALLSERELLSLPVLLAIPFTWHAGNSVLLEGMQGENGSKRRRTGKEMGEKDKLVSALGRARPEQLSRAGCSHHEGSRGRQPRLSPFRNRKCCPQPRFSLCGTNPSLHQKPPSLPTEVLWRIFEAGENHQQQQRDEAPREKKTTQQRPQDLCCFLRLSPRFQGHSLLHPQDQSRAGAAGAPMGAGCRQPPRAPRPGQRWLRALLGTGEKEQGLLAMGPVPPRDAAC